MSDPKTKLDARTVLIARHPDGRQVLLLQRAEHKKLFPGLITGIGGAVEFAQGEQSDLLASLLREVAEETAIRLHDLQSPALRLCTLEARGTTAVLLFWFTATLTRFPDLSTPEGTLAFHDPDNLPLNQMIPSARYAIPKVLALNPNDTTLHTELIPPENQRE